MELKTQHSFIIGASRTQAWSFLWDIEAVAKCIPGCEKVLVLDESKSYKAHVRRQVGPFLIRFELDITVLEIVAYQRLKVEVTGEDKRLRSRIAETVTLTLSDVDGGQCQIGIATHFQLSGMLASLGERLLSAQIEQELDIFLSCVRSRLEDQTVSAAG
jgi:carbon monoxide dehydrogenase subunit G